MLAWNLYVEIINKYMLNIKNVNNLRTAIFILVGTFSLNEHDMYVLLTADEICQPLRNLLCLKRACIN